MKTMDRSRCHNHVAVRMVQQNILPSEATVIRDLMQTLGPRLSFLILGIFGEIDHIALEGALSLNSAMVAFQQRLNATQEGRIKQAYMNLYSYFRKLASPGAKLQESCIKWEKQEGNENGVRGQDFQQYTAFERMNF
ncbi:hypothetical protein N7463_003333 [Penicillium fimorum]|uniref:Uncharacterized protein n=1 Tax=Penicillium fimorum TaxID=1882269 RepID=A0A9W9Y0T2_9EURO|nr:hypothetical protein N7463_003333 [Penicillium fimorum]